MNANELEHNDDDNDGDKDDVNKDNRREEMEQQKNNHNKVLNYKSYCSSTTTSLSVESFTIVKRQRDIAFHN